MVRGHTARVSTGIAHTVWELLITLCEEEHGLGHPQRCLKQPFAVRLLPNGLQQLLGCPRKPFLSGQLFFIKVHTYGMAVLGWNYIL